MSRRCAITGKGSTSGKSYTRSGLSRKKGGGGQHITGKTKRKFKPNLQKVRVVVDGQVKRIRVSTRAIKSGLVVRPLVRQKPAAVSK